MEQHTTNISHLMAAQNDIQSKVKSKPNIPNIFLSVLFLSILFFISGKQETPLEELAKPIPTYSQPTIKRQPSIDPFRGVDHAQIDAVMAGMSLEEKIGQLVIWTPDLSDPVVQAQASGLVLNSKISGLLLPKMSVKDYLFWKENLEWTSDIPLLSGTAEKVALHGQFEGAANFPNPTSIAALDSAGLKGFLNEAYLEQCQALGMQFSLRPALPNTDVAGDEQLLQMEHLQQDVERMAKKGLLGVASNFSFEHIEASDSLGFSQLMAVHRLVSKGLPGLFLEESIFENERIKNAPIGFVQQYLHRQMGFQGVAFTKLLEGESPELKLLQGADLFLTSDIPDFFHYAKLLTHEDKLTKKDLDNRVRRILKAKAWAYGGRLPIGPSIQTDNPHRQNARTVSFVEKKNFFFSKKIKTPPCGAGHPIRP